MAEITLFSARACPFAHRTRLVLAEKRLDFELVEIDLQNKPAWFHTVSSYGKVPALQHGQVRVVESAIVNEYLDEVFPEPALLPKDPGERATARIWIDYANTRFVPAWGALLRGQTEAERSSARTSLLESLEYIETQGLEKNSGDGPFWFGAKPSLVDLSFYPWFERWPALEHYRGALPILKFERLRRLRDALAARASVKDIQNPTTYYVERYAKHAAPLPQAVAV
ncbi:MAG TPA: glutathione S-transferase family protein [Polyangiaceae bacterium]